MRRQLPLGTSGSGVDLISPTGFASMGQLRVCHTQRRVNADPVRCYDEIYPSMECRCLLQTPYPESFKKLMATAQAESF